MLEQDSRWERTTLCMVDGVESCCEVEEDKNTEVARVWGEKVIGKFEKGQFCAIMWMKTRLKWFKHDIRDKMGFELEDSNMLQYFLQKG